MNSQSKDQIVFNAISYIILTVFVLFCLIPILLLVSGSFTDELWIAQNGFGLIPGKVSFEAYRLVFAAPAKIISAYSVTIFITVVGTVFSLLFSTMAAYVLAKKEFRYRNLFSLYFYFTTIFSGGLVPFYILIVQYLQLKNTLLVLILVHLFSVFNMIILRSFISTIPDSLGESAKIDGAGDLRIFFRIVLPLSKPALATIALFTALIYWDEWYYTMLFITRENLYTLQYFLHNILSEIEYLRNAADGFIAAGYRMPTESYKLAMAVVTIGPIIFLYPYLQKYFIKGMMIGAVKG